MQTVIGIFDTAQEAQTAAAQLVSSGFSQSNIDISAQDSTAASNTGTSHHSDNDGIGGFFRSLFGGDDEHNRYSHVARRSTVLTVHAKSSEEAHRAADILDRYGAVDVNERAAQYGYTGSAGTTATAATTTDTAASTGTSIPIIEENIVVGKRVVETGGVRLRSRIVERPVEEHLRLRQEHVLVTRTPVNRPVTEADRATLAGGTIEAIEHAEVPVVAKQARVVEEVRLAKDVEEREEIVRDTVRSTDVDVEQFRAEETSRRTGLDEDLNRPSGL